MQILNLTQHKGSPEQIKAGLVEPPDEEKRVIQKLLTFDNPPNSHEIWERARKIANMCPAKCVAAMIGGAPFLMSCLEVALINKQIRPLYAFTKRVVTEKAGVKTSVFKHVKFIGVGL